MRLILMAVLAMASCLGCADGGNAPVETVGEEKQPVSTTELKQRLTEIAQTGEAGSALAGVRETLEQMKQTDPQKAEALLKDLDELETANNPARIREIATRMANSL